MTDAPFDLVAVRYGRPALDALRELLSTAKATDPLAPVTVVVPNNFVGVATRRALASGAHGAVSGAGPGLAGVDFLTLYRLAERLGSPTLVAAGRRPVSTPVIASAIRQVLNGEPGIFSPVAEHPTTERRLVQAHRELSDVDDQGLEALRAASARAREVVRIHCRARALLAPQWFAEQDLLAAAGDAITSSRPGGLGKVVVFLPDELTAPRADLLRVLHAAVGVTVVVALTGVPDADAGPRGTLARLGIEAPPIPRDRLPHTRATNVSDPDDEVRHVVREVLAGAAGGIGFDEMAVVYATDQPYARLLHDHLTAADVPFNGAAVGGLAASVVGRTLLGLLELADHRLRREDVMGLVASLPFRWRNRPAPTRAWEQISREAGVVRGLDEWQLRLGRYIHDQTADAEALARNPETEWRAARCRLAAERAADLLSFVEHLHGELERAARSSGWSARVAWCRTMLRRHLGDLRDWPKAEVDAAERLDLVLERLAGLDAIDDPPSTPVFRRVLEAELEAGLGRVGRLGDGILIGRAWAVAGLALQRVWVLGMSEGSFPSRPVDDSLLPDRERVATSGQLRPRRELVGDEHRYLLAAVAAVAPAGSVHFLRSRGDLRASSERVESRWLAELRPSGDAEARPGTMGSSSSWDVEVASFARGIASATFPATAQEHDLQSMLGAGAASAAQVVDDDGAFAASVNATLARRAPAFSRFDGKVPPTLVPPMDAVPTSATGLETWAKCPHAFFVRHLLGVMPLESPEQRLRIDALARGTLIHTILDRFVSIRGLGGTNDRWDDGDREALMAIADACFADVHARGLTGEAIYWRRDQVLLRRDLRRFLDEDNARRSEAGLRPIHSELRFGAAAAPPVRIELPGGRGLWLRGSIDRVDEAADGTLHVIDYKSGRAFKVDNDAPHGNGTRLQLVLYAQAARAALGRFDAPVHSAYWFVSRNGGFQRAGYLVTDAVVGSVNQAVATIVDNIEAGVFPQHPDAQDRGGASVSCPYCDPDGLGTRAERRRFEVLASDPDLAAYVALAEPELLAPAALPGSSR